MIRGPWPLLRIMINYALVLRVVGSAVERIPDKNEVDGPTPSRPTKLTFVGNLIYTPRKMLPDSVSEKNLDEIDPVLGVFFKGMFKQAKGEIKPRPVSVHKDADSGEIVVDNKPLEDLPQD